MRVEALGAALVFGLAAGCQPGSTDSAEVDSVVNRSEDTQVVTDTSGN